MNCNFKMFRWGFLLLAILIPDTANGNMCSKATRFNEEKLNKNCNVHASDDSILKTVAANRDYGLCMNAYGFVAVLDNPAMPGLTCIGAIISDRWVLDNCLESPKFKYQRIKIGAMMNPPNIREYRIQHTIKHNFYKRAQFTKHGYNTRYLFAAKDSLFLRKTQSRMIMSDGVCPISLHNSKILPDRGAYSVYSNQSAMRSKVMHITPSICCNYHFVNYFPPEQQWCLTDSQYCVSTRRIKPSECCHSQALMIYAYSLLGVMSWSTGCSSEVGVDPWVFSNIAYYRDWVQDNTNLDL